MTLEEHAKYWLESAQHDLSVAEQLFLSGKYDWCLFIGQLVIEKTLKAIFVINNQNRIPPKTHNLLKLAELSRLALSQEQELFLDTINDFNIEVRYPEYKKEFYKTCTKEFAEDYFNKIVDVQKWLKSLIAFEK